MTMCLETLNIHGRTSMKVYSHIGGLSLPLTLLFPDAFPKHDTNIHKVVGLHLYRKL